MARTAQVRAARADKSDEARTPHPGNTRYTTTHGRVVSHTRMVELILLSRLGGPDFALNPDLIERAEETPDTVVTLVGGNKYVIRETLEELMDLINHNRAQVIANAELIRAELGRGAESAGRHPAAPRPPEHKRENTTELHAVVPLHPTRGA